MKKLTVLLFVLCLSFSIYSQTFLNKVAVLPIEGDESGLSSVIFDGLYANFSFLSDYSVQYVPYVSSIQYAAEFLAHSHFDAVIYGTLLAVPNKDRYELSFSILAKDVTGIVLVPKLISRLEFESPLDIFSDVDNLAKQIAEGVSGVKLGVADITFNLPESIIVFIDGVEKEAGVPRVQVLEGERKISLYAVQAEGYVLLREMQVSLAENQTFTVQITDEEVLEGDVLALEDILLKEQNVTSLEYESRFIELDGVRYCIPLNQSSGFIIPFHEPYFGFAVGGWNYTFLSFGLGWDTVNTQDKVGFYNAGFILPSFYYDEYPLGGHVYKAGLAVDSYYYTDDAGTVVDVPGAAVFAGYAYQFRINDFLQAELGATARVGGLLNDQQNPFPAFTIEGGPVFRFGPNFIIRLTYGAALAVLDGSEPSQFMSFSMAWQFTNRNEFLLEHHYFNSSMSSDLRLANDALMQLFSEGKNPSDEDHNLIARSYMLAGDTASAISYYRKFYPDRSDFRYRLNHAFLLIRKWDTQNKGEIRYALPYFESNEVNRLISDLAEKPAYKLHRMLLTLHSNFIQGIVFDDIWADLSDLYPETADRLSRFYIDEDDQGMNCAEMIPWLIE